MKVPFEAAISPSDRGTREKVLINIMNKRAPGIQGPLRRAWGRGDPGAPSGPLGKAPSAPLGEGGPTGALRGSWGPWERFIEAYSKSVPNAQVASSWAVLRTKNVGKRKQAAPEA